MVYSVCRRYILIGFLFIIIISSWHVASAQILLGPKIGANIGSFAIANQGSGVSNSMKLGLIIGGVFEIPLNENISLQIEPAYIQKGNKVNIPLTPAAIATLKVEYIQIPITVKVPLSSSNIRPYAFAGPNIGFRVKASGVFEPSDAPISPFNENDYSKLDYGFDFGLGIETNVSSSEKFIADVRYSLGIANIYKASGNTIHTRGIQAFIGMLIAL
jgi:hypothetical protein